MILKSIKVVIVFVFFLYILLICEQDFNIEIQNNLSFLKIKNDRNKDFVYFNYKNIEGLKVGFKGARDTSKQFGSPNNISNLDLNNDKKFNNIETNKKKKVEKCNNFKNGFSLSNKSMNNINNHHNIHYNNDNNNNNNNNNINKSIEFIKMIENDKFNTIDKVLYLNLTLSKNIPFYLLNKCQEAYKELLLLIDQINQESHLIKLIDKSYKYFNLNNYENCYSQKLLNIEDYNLHKEKYQNLNQKFEQNLSFLNEKCLLNSLNIFESIQHSNYILKITDLIKPFILQYLHKATNELLLRCNIGLLTNQLLKKQKKCKKNLKICKKHNKILYQLKELESKKNINRNEILFFKNKIQKNIKILPLYKINELKNFSQEQLKNSHLKELKSCIEYLNIKQEFVLDFQKIFNTENSDHSNPISLNNQITGKRKSKKFKTKSLYISKKTKRKNFILNLPIILYK